MIEAFILLNLKPGSERKLEEELKNVKDVKIIEYKYLYGEYDMIIKIEADVLEDIRKFVMDNLRRLDYVERTISLIVAP